MFSAIKDIPQDEGDAFAARYRECNSPEAKKSKSYFGLTYHVLASRETKPQLPIAIHVLLLHFDFIIGNPESEEGFKLNVMYDSGVALTVDYSVFYLKVAKNYPFLVKTIWSTQEKIIA